MKNLICFTSLLSIFLFASCEYEIIDSKPGESIKPVTNLEYSVSGSELILSWELPSTYPDDIILPVSVRISILRDGQNFGTVVLDDSPESFTYSSYEPSKDYLFIVKVKGEVNTDNPHRSNLRYSLGEIVEIK